MEGELEDMDSGTRDSIGAQIRRGGMEKSNCQSATFVPLWLCSSLPSELVPISLYLKIPVYEVFEWAIFVVVFFSTMNDLIIFTQTLCSL